MDSRRAHNCNILLSKMKMSNREIHHAILGMEDEDVISSDMVEQLLKFVPTQEEVSVLEPLADQCHLFAKADRFIYDMSQIPHFSQRLRGLDFLRKVRPLLLTGWTSHGLPPLSC